MIDRWSTARSGDCWAGWSLPVAGCCSAWATPPSARCGAAALSAAEPDELDALSPAPELQPDSKAPATSAEAKIYVVLRQLTRMVSPIPVRACTWDVRHSYPGSGRLRDERLRISSGGVPCALRSTRIPASGWTA